MLATNCMKKTKHKLTWFTNRIGQTIYREPLRMCKYPECGCYKDHVVVYDRRHAEYLLLGQNELGIEYFDKPISE